MADMNDWNTKVVEEFRANDGRVGGRFEGAPLLLLHTLGRTSGIERVNPMMYQRVDDGWAVFASKGGADTDPDWFRNLVATPEATIEVGTRTRRVRARVAEGRERTDIWSTQKERFPAFAEYEDKTSREIPVVVLEPID
jgi:deazaflavin-dependent oxidoreductase (nitroreductase family)